MLGGMQ